jgi:hypothetical protein
MNKLSRLVLAASLLAGLATASGAWAQSACASDGVPQPVALVERFINADCEACWGDAKTPVPGRGELALDWIVPGNRGQDAPLAVMATRDSLARLQRLGRKVPPRAEVSRRKPQPPARSLRVARGLPFNGYIGASIELKPGERKPWNAWLLLVETLPAGSDGTPVERDLVRGVLQPAWDDPRPRSKEEEQRLFESRPMRIPEGANPWRLRVVGWVEDARGRIRAIAQSRCVPESSKG